MRLSSLKYTSELGDPTNIITAMKRLCGDISPPTLKPVKPKPPKGTADDAISISDDEEEDPPCEVKAEPAPEGTVPILYADDETQIPLRELLGCLLSDELSEVGRSFKVKRTLKVRFTHKAFGMRLTYPPNRKNPSSLSCSRLLPIKERSTSPQLAPKRRVRCTSRNYRLGSPRISRKGYELWSSKCLVRRTPLPKPE